MAIALKIENLGAGASGVVVETTLTTCASSGDLGLSSSLGLAKPVSSPGTKTGIGSLAVQLDRNKLKVRGKILGLVKSTLKSLRSTRPSQLKSEIFTPPAHSGSGMGISGIKGGKGCGGGIGVVTLPEPVPGVGEGDGDGDGETASAAGKYKKPARSSLESDVPTPIAGCEKALNN